MQTKYNYSLLFSLFLFLAVSLASGVYGIVPTIICNATFRSLSIYENNRLFLGFDPGPLFKFTPLHQKL